MPLINDFHDLIFCHNVVVRSRITDQITSEKRSKFILITAPAGYGKTSLLSQYLIHQPRSSWFSIEDTDNHPDLFFPHFILAAKAVSKHPFSKTTTLLKTPTECTPRQLAHQFIAEYSSIDHQCHIVLDNYQNIHHSFIHHFFKYLLINLPQTLQLYIISRTTPPFNLAKIQLEGRLVYIKKHQLAFTEQETNDFLDSIYINTTLSDELKNILFHYSHGWIAPLILLLDNYQNDTVLLHLINQREAHLRFPQIDHYIEEEILKELPENLLQCCMKMSLLSSFTYNQAMIICEENNVIQCIEDLLALGLLSLDKTKNNHFTYHPIIQKHFDFLRLKNNQGKDKKLIGRTIKAYLSEEFYDEAIELSITHKLEAPLVDIVLTFGWKLLNKGKLISLKTALSQLPERLLYKNITIVCLTAWLAQAQGDNKLVTTQIIQMHSLLPQHPKFLGQYNVLNAQQYITNNQPKQAIQCAEYALTHLDHTSYRELCIATSIIGEVHHIEGHLEQALSLMQQTERFARQHQLILPLIRALTQQGKLYFSQGILNPSDASQKKALDIIKQYHLYYLPIYPLLVGEQSELFFEKNDRHSAKKWVLHSLKKIKHHFSSHQDILYTSLAKLAIASHQWEAAEDMLVNLSLSNACDLHPEQSEHLSEVTLYLWVKKQKNSAIKQWLNNHQHPEKNCNSFTQHQSRNIIYSYCILGDYKQSEHLLQKIINEARHDNLIVDLYRAYILQSYLYHLQNKTNLTKQSLTQSLKLSAEYGLFGYFYFHSEWVLTYLNDFTRKKENRFTRNEYRHIDKLKHSLNTLYIETNRTDPQQIDNVIFKIKNHQLEIGTPLTPREAQIFGLIYSGWKNTDIADDCHVLPTTIKSHIRNLYQKLSVTNRHQAKELATQILKDEC